MPSRFCSTRSRPRLVHVEMVCADSVGRCIRAFSCETAVAVAAASAVAAAISTSCHMEVRCRSQWRAGDPGQAPNVLQRRRAAQRHFLDCNDHLYD